MRNDTLPPTQGGKGLAENEERIPTQTDETEPSDETRWQNQRGPSELSLSLVPLPYGLHGGLSFNVFSSTNRSLQISLKGLELSEITGKSMICTMN